MYKKIIIIILSIVAFSNLHAGDNNKVMAIVDMDLSSIDNEKEQEDLKGYIFEYFYLNEKKYDILEIDDVDEKLADVDITDLITVSEILNADFLLSGEIRKFTKSYALKFKLYSSDKNEIVSEEEYTFSKRNVSDSEKKKDDEDDDEKKDGDKIITIYDAIDKVCNSVINSYERQVFKERISSEYRTKRSGSSIELSYGLINMSLEPYYDDEDVYDEFYHVAKVGYTYQFNYWFSVGVDVAALFVPSSSEYINSTFNPMFGLQVIFGNKVDGFAGSLGIDFAPTINSDYFDMVVPIYTVGVFYKNFFIKGSYLGVLDASIFYFEAGYSIYLGK